MTKQKRYLLKNPNFIFLNANVVSEAELSLWVRENAPGKDPWLPERFGDVIRFAIKLEDDKLTIFDPRSAGYNDSELPIYELRASIAEIKLKKGPGHLVTHANVSTESQIPDWYFFNDFCALQLPDEHRIFQKWKVPAVILFARIAHETSSTFNLSPLAPNFGILLDNHYLKLLLVTSHRTDLVLRHVPLKAEEIPNTPGFLVAIDAEFVGMALAETEVRSDGTNTIIKPPRFNLARVSVLRGEGPSEGIPFIDDYICTTEPVLDYLTEYSGIEGILIS